MVSGPRKPAPPGDSVPALLASVVLLMLLPLPLKPADGVMAAHAVSWPPDQLKLSV